MLQQSKWPPSDADGRVAGVAIDGVRVPATADVLDDLDRGEQALTLRELAADPSVPHGRAGRPASVATLYRHVLRGRNGHRLGTVKTSRGMVTTRSEWLRYLRRTNDLPAFGQIAGRTPARRDHDVDDALSTLRRMGVA